MVIQNSHIHQRGSGLLWFLQRVVPHMAGGPDFVAAGAFAGVLFRTASTNHAARIDHR